MWPSQVGRAYRLLEMVSEGCPGHGPIHLLVSSAAEIGFRWEHLALAWSRPGLPLLSNLAGPIQHFRAAILDAWRNKAAADLCSREGFRGGPLLRSILVGCVWNGFLLSRVKGQPVPRRFCGSPDSDGHLLRKLRSAVCRVVWSRRQPFASVGAVLNLVDGPSGCDPAFCVVWFRFRLLRRYLALWPAEVGRIFRLLEMVRDGCPGHGPLHLLSKSAAEIGFQWDPVALAWVRPGLPMLDNLAGPIQHFRSAILDAWRNKVAVDLCGREGFRSGPLLDIRGSLQLLNSSHVRDRDEGLLRSVLVGGVWNGFLLSRVKGQPVPCRFCGSPDSEGQLFWECTLPPLVAIRENPEFHDLMREDKAHWPRCLLWHGWLPMLSGVNGASPWAADASESALYLVETALGQYSSGLVSEWSLPDGFDADEVSARMPDAPQGLV